MKFALALALIGAASAAPYGEADASYQRDRQVAAKVVETQQKFEATKSADVAKRFADDTAAANAQKAMVTSYRVDQMNAGRVGESYPTRRQWWGGQPFSRLVQLDAEDNEADVSFQRDRVTAAKTVETQQKFEATKSADVAKRFADDTAAATASKRAVDSYRETHIKDFADPSNLVYIPEEEIYLTLY